MTKEQVANLPPVTKQPTFIEHKKGVLSREFCKRVCDWFDFQETQGSYIIPRSDEYVTDTQIFANQVGFAMNSIVSTLHKPIYDVIGKAAKEYFEKYPFIHTAGSHAVVDFKIQKTRKGEGFTGWHYESGDLQHNRRFLTFMFYLNDVRQGGETEFYYQNLKFKPSAGDLLIWPAGFTHMHKGHPPKKETKYIITTWAEYTG
jgi:hypothetical protein